jgi:hypothetical protein
VLLQTHGYLVPAEHRAAHARLVRRFRAAMKRLGCDRFEAYEQVGSDWAGDASAGRFVQMMVFRDRAHQKQIQQAERDDPEAQQIIAEFVELIDLPKQQDDRTFVTGYYQEVLGEPPTPPKPAGDDDVIEGEIVDALP